MLPLLGMFICVIMVNTYQIYMFVMEFLAVIVWIKVMKKDAHALTIHWLNPQSVDTFLQKQNLCNVLIYIPATIKTVLVFQIMITPCKDFVKTKISYSSNYVKSNNEHLKDYFTADCIDSEHETVPKIVLSKSLDQPMSRAT